MIKTQNLTRIFQTDEIETSALKEVNFNAEKGEFVAMMGPSDCGKSTLLNIVGLLDNPTSGSYLFNGIDIVPKIHVWREFPDELSTKSCLSIYYFPVNEAAKPGLQVFCCCVPFFYFPT